MLAVPTAGQRVGRICLQPGMLSSAGCLHPCWQQWGGLDVPKSAAVSDSDTARLPRGVGGGPRNTLCLGGGEGDFGGEAWSPLLLTGVQVLLLAVQGGDPMV